MLEPHFELESVFHSDASAQQKINEIVDKYNSKSKADKQAFLLVLVAELVFAKEHNLLLREKEATNFRQPSE